MRISNDNVCPGHRQKMILSHNDSGVRLFDRYPWLMKTCIVVGVLAAVGAAALGVRAVFNHDSGEPDVDQIIFETSRSRGHQINKATPSSSTNNASNADSATDASSGK